MICDAEFRVTLGDERGACLAAGSGRGREVGRIHRLVVLVGARATPIRWPSFVDGGGFLRLHVGERFTLLCRSDRRLAISGVGTPECARVQESQHEEGRSDRHNEHLPPRVAGSNPFVRRSTASGPQHSSNVRAPRSDERGVPIHGLPKPDDRKITRSGEHDPLTPENHVSSSNAAGQPRNARPQTTGPRSATTTDRRTPTSGAGGHRTHDRRIVRSRSSVRRVPDSAAEQDVRTPVSVGYRPYPRCSGESLGWIRSSTHLRELRADLEVQGRRRPSGGW